MGEVNLVTQIFQKLKLEDLKKCKDILDSIINREHVKLDQEIKSKHPKDYLYYKEESI